MRGLSCAPIRWIHHQVRQCKLHQPSCTTRTASLIDHPGFNMVPSGGLGLEVGGRRLAQAVGTGSDLVAAIGGYH